MAAHPISPARQLAALLAAALALGTAAQLLSPSRIPWREAWSTRAQTRALKAGLVTADTPAARALAEGGAALVLDARRAADYYAGRIPGALSLPDARRAEAYPLLAEFLTPDQPILVYCSGRTCDESLDLCLYLREMGHTNLVLYLGGFAEWKEAGLPVEK